VISRAQFWLNKGIVYNNDGSYPDPQGKNYRTDCSGYVSMAWHLDHSRVTFDPDNLANVATLIGKNDLRAGDLMMAVGVGDQGHAVLFEGWDDAAHTKYSAYEFGATPVSHSHGIPYPLLERQPHLPAVPLQRDGNWYVIGHDGVRPACRPWSRAWRRWPRGRR
jgi:hypothetical protein